MVLFIGAIVEAVGGIVTGGLQYAAKKRDQEMLGTQIQAEQDFLNLQNDIVIEQWQKNPELYKSCAASYSDTGYVGPTCEAAGFSDDEIKQIQSIKSAKNKQTIGTIAVVVIMAIGGWVGYKMIKED